MNTYLSNVKRKALRISALRGVACTNLQGDRIARRIRRKYSIFYFNAPAND